MKYPDVVTIYGLFTGHPAIATDTRAISPGSLFFALKGPKFNANTFAKEALQKGASFSFIDEEQEYAEGCVLVKDVLQTLQELASFHRGKFNIPVIAITGTNGKTTTKELTAVVLPQKYTALSTKGNFNNHIGVPLTLLSLKKEHEIAVIEMGANHVGEIAALCQIAKPTFGIITNIGKAHLEGFGSYEGVIKAKTELYDYLRTNHGKVFVNRDDSLLLNLSEGIDRITYGTAENSFLRGIADSSFLASGVLTKGQDTEYIHSRFAGSYNFTNIMAASCIGSYFGIDLHLIKNAIEEYFPANNRSQLIKKGTNTIWLDAYNANPGSMRVAIEHFIHYPGEGKMLILGDMFELGESSEKEHQNLADLISHYKGWHSVYLVGQEFSKVKLPQSLKFKDVDSLLNYLTLNPLQNKTILIKGSRGMEMERVVEG